MKRQVVVLSAVVLTALALTSPRPIGCWTSQRALFAAEPNGAGTGGKIDFIKDVRPILAANCFECHGERKQKADLRLDANSLALRGGNSGRVIVPGQGGDSLLVKR